MPTLSADRLAAANLISTFDATGTKPPKAVADAWARVEKVTAAVGNLMPPEGALYRAIFAAVDAGQHPSTDPDVQRLVVSQTIAHAGTAEGVPAIAFDLLRETARAHAGEIVSSLRGPFDAAAAALKAAFNRLGDVALDDAGTILHRGPAAAESWGKAQTAIATIESVRTGWAALDTLTTNRTPSRRHAMLVLADVSADQWDAHNLTDHKAEPWAAVTMGLRLSLPTPAEFSQRVARLQQAQQAEADRQEKAARDRMAGRRPVSAPSS